MLIKLKSSSIREVNRKIPCIPNMVDGINMVNLTAHNMMYDLTDSFCIRVYIIEPTCCNGAN